MADYDISFDFVLESGREVIVFASGFSAGDPGVGIFGPYYEEVWAEDLYGKQIELSETDSDRAFMQAAIRAAERDDEP